MHYIELVLFISIVGLAAVVSLVRYLVDELKKKRLEDALFISSDELLDAYERIYNEQAEDQMEQLTNWRDCVMFNCQTRRSRKGKAVDRNNVFDFEKIRLVAKRKHQ